MSSSIRPTPKPPAEERITAPSGRSPCFFRSPGFSPSAWRQFPVDFSNVISGARFTFNFLPSIWIASARSVSRRIRRVKFFVAISYCARLSERFASTSARS